MAILRSVDGKFYEVPDKDLAKMEIPADEVREKLGDLADQAGPAGPGPGAGGPGGGGGGAGAQVVIQIHGGGDVGGAGGADMPPGDAAGSSEEGVEAYGWWRNCWRNHWRNHWNNYWRNCWRNCY